MKSLYIETPYAVIRAPWFLRSCRFEGVFTRPKETPLENRCFRPCRRSSKYESILFRAAARCVVGDWPLSASLPMPTFGATLRRKNGKLLERSILGLVSLRRTTCPIEYGNAWKSSLLSLYGRAFADVKESTVLLEPTQRPCRIAGIIVHYWRCDLLFTIRVLKWLLESLDCWK